MRLLTLLAAGTAAFAFTAPAAAQYLDEAHDHADFTQQPAQPAPAAPAAPLAPPAAQLADTEWQTELGFEPEVFRAHVAFLADDMLEGRDAGSRGYNLAAHYVATQFQALGVTPGNNGSWYQQVPLARTTGSNGQLTIGGRRFAAGQDMVYLPGVSGGSFAFDAPAVFGGQGIIDAASGRDDLAGLDLAGKVLVIMAAQGSNPNEAIKAAAERGALGAVIIRPREAATVPLSRMAGRGAGGTTLRS